MPKFKKKPVVIEAVLLLNTPMSILEAEQFIAGKQDIGHNTCRQAEDAWEVYEGILRRQGGRMIKTQEGELLASFGDWIVKGESKDQGVHFWPVKPDYFEENYESAE